MIALLLDIYVLFVWLIFYKFKLLKFDLKAKITTGVVGVLFVFGILIAVNFLHPQSLDARVLQHVIEISPRLPQPGRVIEVPIEPNVPVKKGTILFKIDPRPFELDVDRLTAALAQPRLLWIAIWDSKKPTEAQSLNKRSTKTAAISKRPTPPCGPPKRQP
jgi:multidrug resistance efflux pump